MSLAFYASPIDYKNNDLENKIKGEKIKLDKNTLITMQQGTTQGTMQGSLQESPTSVVDIHKNLKEESDVELSNFYNSEIKVPPQYKTNDYMILNGNMIEPKKQTNQELLNKMNKILEMFEDQKEIKTGQKNEEIVLYGGLGLFIIYILDSFVNIGRYSR
jgi:hypothetical protein